MYLHGFNVRQKAVSSKTYILEKYYLTISSESAKRSKASCCIQTLSGPDKYLQWCTSKINKINLQVKLFILYFVSSIRLLFRLDTLFQYERCFQPLIQDLERSEDNGFPRFER